MRGVPSSDGAALIFEPVGETAVITDLRVMFPSSLEPGTAQAYGPDNELSILPLQAALSSALTGPMTTPDGYGIAAPELSVPIAVSTSYVARGESHMSDDVYFIKFSAVAKSNEPLSIAVSKAVFGFRSDSLAAARQEAESMWSMTLRDLGTSSARVRGGQPTADN